MPTEFHSLEENLKDYLVEIQTDRYNSKKFLLYHKYGNLKIYMDPGRFPEAHCIIRIGISEVVYSLENGEKLYGGLGSDERYVRRWIDKTFVKSNLGSAWEKTKKVKTVTTNTDNES